MELRTPLLLREPPRSRTLGFAVAIGSVTLCTLAVYPLRLVAPAVSLGVVYLLAVILVSTFWGLRIGLLHRLRERRRVQLLPHPTRGLLHDRRGPELGRAGGLLRHRGDRQHARGACPDEGSGGGGPPPRGGPAGRARTHPARRPPPRRSAARRGGTDRERPRAALRGPAARRGAEQSGEAVAGPDTWRAPARHVGGAGGHRPRQPRTPRRTAAAGPRGAARRGDRS